MRNKVDIDKRDIYRILHTELLPYEVPLFFSNDRLYTYVKSMGKISIPEIVRTFMTQESYTIPLEYHIRHGATGKRTLGIIHPATQLRFADFYNDYHQLLLSLCGRSEYSLRAPFRVATHFIERHQASHDNSLDDGDVEADHGPDHIPQFGSSYFSYRKYTQLHQFIDSGEFLSLESKFSKLLKFDVKKCFASIYTHTIAWAVKGKEYSKSNRKFDLFENKFDRLMQQSNYNETNGIVVGPEISRIFSEIILQRIDLNISIALKKHRIVSESFAIRRYVDDYYVFANDEKLLNDIFDIAQLELQFYKLYINEVKTKTVTRPFSTPESAAKAAVQNVLTSTVLGWLKELRRSLVLGEHESLLPRSVELQLRSPFRLTTRIARDTKIAVKQANVSFAVVTGYALGALTKEIWRLRKHLDITLLNSDQTLLIGDLLLTIVEILIFFLSMDFRVRSAIRVTQCMVMLNTMTSRNGELNACITERFARRTNELLLSRSIEGPGGIEALNLLAAVKSIREDCLLSSNDLLRVVGGVPAEASENPYSELSYFDLVAILFYVQDGASFESLRIGIEKEIIMRFLGATELSKRSDLCMLFMDIVGCPWVSNISKDEAIKVVFKKLKNKEPSIGDINHIKSFIANNLGFVDWYGTLHLERILNRKELKTVYDM